MSIRLLLELRLDLERLIELLLLRLAKVKLEGIVGF